MKTVLLSKEDYEQLEQDLKDIKAHVKKITVPNEAFLDNKAFTKLMNISFRTAQVWRDEGKIGFSQEGKKIYYRLSDIETFLDNHHKAPFAYKQKLRENFKDRY